MNSFPIDWTNETNILTVSSKRSLGSVCERIRALEPAWVVIRRVEGALTPFAPYFYAFRPEELLVVDRDFPHWRERPVEEALDLHEHGSSTPVAGSRQHEADRVGSQGPASWRAIHLGVDAEPAAVGELRPREAAAAPPAPASRDEDAAFSPPDAYESTGEESDGGGPHPPAYPAEERGPESAEESGVESRAEPGAESAEESGAEGDARSGAESPDESGAEGDAGVDAADDLLDLGPTRGGSSREGRRTRSRSRGRREGEVRRMNGSEAARAADGAGEESADAGPPESTRVVTISADAERQIRTGSTTYVIYQIELEGEAAPLQERFSTEVTASEPIHIVFSTDSDTLEVVGERIQSVQPPGAGQPSRGTFEIRAPKQAVKRQPNIARLALLFRQGATELGQIAFSVLIVDSADEQAPERARAQVEAAPRVRTDDELLVLLIEQERHGDGIRYEYRLHGETLDLNYLTLQSAPLLDRGGGAAATTVAYVEAIYERVTQDVLSRSDANRLQREVRALGGAMCGELFDPEVTRQIWPLRDRIKTIQIVSWEPYIPWELLRLRHPDTSDLDDRFLCEYGMVRSMPGAASPRQLRLDDWQYLAAQYPNGLESPVAGEVEYFTHSLPARGIQPTSVSSSYDAFFDALEDGDFDVLHIACHGESEHGHIENSVLIIGDERGPDGQPRPLAVDAITVQQEARLKARRPLIFLNACESGRHGPSLTAWGGWPSAFLKAGAGVFVGTSWPVREKPARIFAQTFYDALLEGTELASAATAAREATRDLGDASWLAFKVYGHPRARV